MTISQRTIKIALATVISILIAQFFQLEYTVSAGIIAILSVLDTKKSSVTTAIQRVISTILALTIATILFQLFGFNTYIFGIYLFFYVPLAYRFNVQSGIAPCSVLVTHLLLEKSTSLTWVLNEFSLMLIGAGIAILFNLYMPSKATQIISLREQVEAKMREVLLSFDRSLQDGRGKNQFQLLDELDDLLEKARQVVYVEFDNQLLAQSTYDIRYFDMRKEQSTILRYMAINLNLCRLPTRENKILAGMFYLTADQLHEQNTGIYLMDDINALLQFFRESELPVTRAEFENRAILFQLLNDFTRFIQTKKDFYEAHADVLNAR
ncbi:Hypothetical protein Tpal_6 [Trichococcus palustris]|uniref:Putative aromatic acid exporter C-terminal domain-containing protein n=1 Tax=Trichococcus palustris TaxID=140314 RepID=A0A143Y535_9LACT|nr:aromatic acid exporter family protein [Trichococcus palustris]CZQ79833.1 Hypothetical protein Tpal_6 [Trichococcus palustris]SFL09182.1 Uncharacterized membrane protein YgaE, UPF0421/DUF939 family [Trichococcus palustris]